jgi:hypothetical protein
MKILTELENTSSSMKHQNYEKVDEFMRAVEELKDFYRNRPTLLYSSEKITIGKVYSLN